MVSPANSFGFMDGGIDRAYVERFGRSLQDRVQDLIFRKHHGELLVGAADIVATGAASHPWLVVAPTMRVPLALRDSVNPYLAARAVFLFIRHCTFDSGPHAGQPIRNHVTSMPFLDLALA